MHIWLLTSELPSGIAAGIARYVDNFARVLGAHGHSVVIIASGTEAADRELAPGVRLISFRTPDPTSAAPAGIGSSLPYPYDVIGHAPGRSFQMAEVVFDLADRLGAPDVIESQEYEALPYYLVQRKLTERSALERTPVVVHLHGPLFEIARINQEARYRFPGYWIGRMEKFGVLAADAVVSPSRFLATSVMAEIGQPLAVEHVPLPLCADSMEVAPAPEAGRLVYVGRLEWRKGIVPLVEGCSRLWAAGKGFTLSLVGQDCVWASRDTTTRTLLQERYGRWIDRGLLELSGPVSHAEVLRRMQRAWAVVVPSLWDNFPNTCMEAMALGAVVLASRSGGQAEMIEESGVNGFLFDWNVDGDLEVQMERLLALRAGEHSRIGEAARRRIRSLCAPEVVLPRRLDHYQRAIDAGARRTTFPSLLGRLPQGGGNGSAVGAGGALSRGGPELSVVIPFFNLGPYLDEALDSVGAATFPVCETLVVDDGSTDAASRMRLEALERQPPPGVRVVRQANQGLARTRNHGAEAARGEFVAFLDADDRVEPDFFARAVDVLQRFDNVGFVYSWVRYFENEAGVWPTWNAEFPYLLGHNMLAPIVVVRRQAFLEHGRNRPEMEYGLEDFEAWIGLLAAGYAGVSLPRPLVGYRVRSGSMFRRCSVDQRLYLYELITRFHADLYREWGAELLNLQNANGPAHLWSHPSTDLGSEAAAHAGVLRAVAYRLWNRVRRLAVERPGDGRLPEIERLLADSSTVLGLLDNEPSAGAPAADGAWSLDYETGARLVGRLRRSWLAQQVLRHERLKQAVKRAFHL